MNAIEVLKASIMTPDSISKDSRNPEQILKDLMGGSFSQEKLVVLMARPDVTGFQAHKLLNITTGSCFFEPLLQLYIEKFIMRNNKYDGLCYMIMTLQLWIEPYSHDYRRGNAVRMLLSLKPVILSFLKKWKCYRNSAVLLFTDIEDFITSRRNYNEISTFPGDEDSPFPEYYDSIQRDLGWWILPFIGRVVLEMVLQKKYYQNSLELKAFATREYFACPGIAGPLYIKSIEETFTVSDIRPFIEDYMETFLLSEDGEKSRKHFCSICEKAEPDEILPFLHYRIEFAGFQFKDNEVYKNFSLEEKINFLKPYLLELESNYWQKERTALFKMWIDDPSWNDPQKSVQELMLLALRNRGVFSFNSSWQFSKLVVVFLRRLYGNLVFEAEVNYHKWLYEISKGEGQYSYVSARDDSDYGKHLKNNPGLLIASINELEKLSDVWFCQGWEFEVREMNNLFIKVLVSYLPEYSIEDACMSVISANACGSKEAIDLLIKRELNYNQAIDLLGNKRICSLSIDPLKQVIMSWFNSIESDIKYLETAVYLFSRFDWAIKAEELFPSVISRKSFDDLGDLLDHLIKAIKSKNVDGLGHFYFNEEKHEIETLRVQIEKAMETRYCTEDEARLFCNCNFFDSYKNWVWFYGKYSLSCLDEIESIPLKEYSVIRLFSGEIKPKEQFLNLWKKTPIRETFVPLVMKCVLQTHYLHEHPEWGTLSLQERLNLFTKEKELSFDKMFTSFGIDFARVWTEGCWNTEKYLNAIELFDSYDQNRFARFAIF